MACAPHVDEKQWREGGREGGREDEKGGKERKIGG